MTTPTNVPKLSFGSWAFSFGPFADDPWPFDRLCDFVRDAGYDGVEINGFRPHPHDEDYRSAGAARGLARSIAERGLEISAYAPDLMTVPPASQPAGYLQRIDSVLRFCDQAGVSLVRLDSVSPPHEQNPRDDDDFRTLVETWRLAADRAMRAGVTLVWEFEPGFWLNRPSDVVRLLGAVDHPHFKVLFDSCHAYTGAVAAARHPAPAESLPGGISEYAQLLEPWIGHLHLIDSDGSLHDNDTSDHLPFGQGKINFAADLEQVASSLLALPWWTIDFCFCPTTEEDAPLAVPFARDLIAELTKRVETKASAQQ